MDRRRPSLLTRLWLPLTVGVLALLVIGAKLSVRSVATGQPVIPGLASAPVLGPQASPTATALPGRVRVRVQVNDVGGAPVGQAMVEIRDRFNKVEDTQETSTSGTVILAVPSNTGYAVTARKAGFNPGNLASVDVAAPPPTPIGTSQGTNAPRPSTPTLQVRMERATAVGVAASAGRLYVGHTTPRISLVDSSSNLLLKHSEPLGQGRQTLATPARDGARIFTTWNGSPDLLVLDASSFAVERQTKFDNGGITALAVSPQTGRLWVSTLAPDAPETAFLNELDPAGQQVLRRIPINQSISGLRFRPDGTILYVRHRSASMISYFDPAGGTTMRMARLPQWPTDVAISPDSSSLWVVNLGSERLVELDAISGDIKRSIEIGAGATGVAAHPDGRRVYTVNQMLGYVQVIDVARGEVSDLIPVGRAPQALAFSPDSTGLYVANAASGTVSLVDLELKQVRETVSTGGSPSSLMIVVAGAA